ncbi:MAG: hypothetical protein EZS28_050911, partial [Streblomastix strix]
MYFTTGGIMANIVTTEDRTIHIETYHWIGKKNSDGDVSFSDFIYECPRTISKIEELIKERSETFHIAFPIWFIALIIGLGVASLSGVVFAKEVTSDFLFDHDIEASDPLDSTLPPHCGQTTAKTSIRLTPYIVLLIDQCHQNPRNFLCQQKQFEKDKLQDQQLELLEKLQLIPRLPKNLLYRDQRENL